MATVDKLPMLAEGHATLITTLRRLKEEERPQVVEAIEVARAHGDLSENAEYHAAKERQGQIEAQMIDLEDRLARAVVIDPTTLSGDKVVFGGTVHLLDEDESRSPTRSSARPKPMRAAAASAIRRRSAGR